MLLKIIVISIFHFFTYFVLFCIIFVYFLHEGVNVVRLQSIYRKRLETFEYRLKFSITNNQTDNPRTCASCRFTYLVRKPPRRRGRNSMPKIMKEFHVFAKLPSIGDIVPSLSFSLSSHPEYRFGQTWWSLRLGSSIICAINRKFFSLCIIAEKRMKRGKKRGGLRGKWFH